MYRQFYTYQEKHTHPKRQAIAKLNARESEQEIREMISRNVCSRILDKLERGLNTREFGGVS